MAQWSGPFLKSQRDRVIQLMDAGILTENSVNSAYRAAMEHYIQHMIKAHQEEKKALGKSD